MVEKDELGEQEQPTSLARQGSVDLFNELAELEPIREPELVEGDLEEQSLEQAERYSPNLTDFQTLIKHLRPDFGHPTINAMLSGRISPDVFKRLLRLLVNSEIKHSPPGKRINVELITAKYYTALSIGLDGKGIIDLLEGYGGTKSDAELDKISKGLGL